MVLKRHLFLVGFMGAGKSSVGKLLAKRLDTLFVDLDEVIVKTCGQSINEIFARHGEEYFRDVETDALRCLDYRQPVVVATGGGILERRGNADIIRSKGVMIYLDASWETVYRRISTSSNRPILQQKTVEEVRSLFQRRQAAYRCADMCVNTDDCTIEMVVDKIVSNIENGD